MRGFVSVCATALFASSLIVGCLGVDPPEGHLACTMSSECPTTWVCRADHRCWRTDDGTDGGALDGGPHDGGPDTSVDAGAHDTGPIDGGEVDGGGDGGIECANNGDCDDSNMCTDDRCNAAHTCDHAAHDCSDGVACTMDSCSTATGCGHVNDDGVCGTNRTCAPTDGTRDANGCIMAPMCTMDAMCDDSAFCTDDACTGGHCTHTAHPCPSDANPCTVTAMCDETNDVCAEPFDPTSVSAIGHCGNTAASCMMCTTALPNEMPTCVAGACGAACTLGHVDVDHNPANGCECTITGIGDFPDDLAADANCDGADGVIGTAIYVTVAGAGSHDGNSPATAATLVEGFALAHSSPRHLLLLASGVYSIAVTLTTVDGMNLVGGYAADFRSRSGTSRVTSSAASALTMASMTSGGIDSVDWATTARVAPGESAHTIDITHSTGLTLRRLTITAGDGAPGAAGTAGAGGIPGGIGTDGLAGVTAVPGGGASGGATGGGGGAGGGNAGTTALPGMPGSNATMIGSGCGRGATTGGTAANPSQTTCITATGGVGVPGLDGCGVGSAASAAGGMTPGAIVGGVWTPRLAGMGTAGVAGGGGGGGSGGGAAHCGTLAAGGGGGAGGEGGGGGGGGRPGGPGGASIGILSDTSSFTLDTVTVVTGRGGAGGIGGDGGSGAAGGRGGRGGRGGSNGSNDGGLGGVGGTGGTGSDGGCGGGGAGGDSVDVAGVSSSMVTISVTLTRGTGGAGGAQCNASGAGMTGSVGVAADRLGI